MSTLLPPMGQTLKVTGALVSQTDNYPIVFVIEDTVDRVRDSFCMSPDKITTQACNDVPFCSIRRCTPVLF
ncbi:hypothetical protein TNCV_3319131 [Trichonephila clavipes]|nr:hypothetical protein TNCV_3319131 [Trichonephila clavipes]